MTTLHAPPDADALAVVRQALLARARADAARSLAEADAEVEATRADAEREAAATREEARARGRADAEAVRLASRAQARREARAVVLGAHREAYEALRRQVRATLSGLQDEPGWHTLRERLVERARADLGAAGPTHVGEPRGGGVLAEAGGRRAVYALEALADRAVDDLGVEVEALWTP